MNKTPAGRKVGPLVPFREMWAYLQMWFPLLPSQILHDEITTIDNALTRPWTVTKNYRRDRDPIWIESICTEANPHIRLGKENYMLSADGYLMPAKKNQQPPDLKYFSQSQK